MANFFGAIWDFILMIWNVISNIFLSLIMLLNSVQNAMIIPTHLAMYTFAPLAACIIAVGAVAVIKIIIGRDNN